jgi:squalene synthase HpnC
MTITETTRASAGAVPDPRAVMARADGENFPVASRLLPPRRREHLLAVYGYARLVDEIGDGAAGDAHAALDDVEEEVRLVYHGEPRSPLMRRLAQTVRDCDIPPEPLRALIAANRQDQEVHAYGTFAELAGYCELSANPVGHLVLEVFDAATPERRRLSDRICTALQLVEHWQDVVEDLRRGRVYVPAEDLREFGCVPADLALRPAPERVRRLLRFEVARARGLLEEGAPLIPTLHGWARVAVAGFVAGGRTALRAVERAGYDVSGGAPRASGAARASATVPALLGRRWGS